MYEHVKRKLKSTNSNKQIQEFKETNPGIQTNKSRNLNKQIHQFKQKNPGISLFVGI